MVHEGPARVFDCEEDAIAAIKGGKIVAGDVVVIRYEGPKGGPGMREMLNPTSAIAGMGLGSSVALMKRWQQEKQNGSHVNQESQPDILQDMLQWLHQATEERSLKCRKQNN